MPSPNALSAYADYVPLDRRQALAAGAALAEHAEGAVLLADMAGFTPLTETIAQVFGPHRGAEELLLLLNRLYEALIAECDRFGGSVVGFAGDAITVWFPREAAEPAAAAALRAAACALAMQAALRPMRTIPIPNGPTLTVALKTTVGAGPVRRLLVGDPAQYVTEVLAGATMTRLGAAAARTRRDEVRLEAEAARLLAGHIVPGAEAETLQGLLTPAPERPWPALPAEALSAEQVRPWLLPPVYARLRAGQGEFLTELRPTVSLFVKFTDLDYDHDPAAGARLDAYIRWVQACLTRHAGWLLQVTLGDKGSYLYAAFGAPVAHGDDAARAAAAALALQQPPPELAEIGRAQIGVSGGLSRVGAVGATTRTYGVIGDATNVAARLMEAAAGQPWVSANLAPALSRRFQIEWLAPLQLKGKARPVPVLALHGARSAELAHLAEPQPALPLVGRRAELAEIEARLALAAAGQGQIVVITGEAGLGKSRLLAEALNRAAAAGFTSLGGAAHSTSTQTAYAAWQPIWRGFFGLEPRAPAEAQLAHLEHQLEAALHPRLPLLGEALNLTVPENEVTRSLDARLRKESREALLTDCLRLGLPRRGAPLALVLEDAHWLDALSVDLLAVIGRALAQWPVLLLVAARPPEAAHTALPVLALPHCTEVALTQLSPAEAGQFVEHRIALEFPGQPAPAPAVVATIAARAEGNPFYIEELLSYARDRGVALSDPAALERLELPGSLASLVLSRIDQLSTEQQTTLKVASVIGRSFAAEWLWGVYPQLGTEARVREDLEWLARLNITPLDTPEPELIYLFRHATTQEVAYASMPFGMRAQLHGQLAGWLEGQPTGPTLDLLAYHYGRSANRAKQREYLRRAGEAAAARYANPAAITYFTGLLEVLDPDEHGPTLLALARLLAITGASAAAEARCREAAALAERLGQTPLHAEALKALGMLKRTLGAYAEAEALLTAARAHYTALADHPNLIEVLSELAFVYLYQARAEAAQTLVEQGLALAEAEGQPRLVARALHILGTVAWFRTDFPAARHNWLKSIALKRALGDKPGVADLGVNLATTAFDEGRYDEAYGLITESVALYAEMGARRQYAQARLLVPPLLMMRGEAEAAWALQTENLALARDLHALQQVADGLVLLGWQTQQTRPTAAAFRYALQLVGAAARLLKEQGSQMIPFTRKRAASIKADGQQVLGEAGAAEALAAGEALTWQAAVAVALAGPG